MTVVLRPGTAADAAACGPICYEAFKAVARPTTSRRTFRRPRWRPGCCRCCSPIRASIRSSPRARPRDRQQLPRRALLIVGVGPITVDPGVQNRGTGARLMQDAIERAARQKAAGVRLLQAGFHNRSLCLYTQLGFRTREPMSVLQGPPLGRKFPGYEVRPATMADVAACNRICRQVHGFDRDGRGARRDRAEDRVGRRASRADHRLHDRDRLLRPHRRARPTTT